MESVVKKELQKWKESIAVEKLSEYDVTVVNIILNNFDELSKSGTAYGMRNQKFANLVEEKKVTVTISCVIFMFLSRKKYEGLKRLNLLKFNRLEVLHKVEHLS